MSSNIPLARETLKAVLRAGDISDWSRVQIKQALKLMTRQSPVKRSIEQRVEITTKMRRQIMQLAARDLSHHEIATRVGLRNAGRVSEVLNGKR